MTIKVALVLAAGLSKRYGSDKRLAGSSTPMVCRSLSNICSIYSDVFVIHRHYDPLLLKITEDFNVNYICANASNIGIGESISQGVVGIVNAIGMLQINSITIFLADMPFVSSQSIKLINTAACLDKIIRVSYKNSFGHPVCFGHAFINQLVTCKGDEGASKVVKNNLNALVKLPVDDPGILKDIDSPSDWLSNEPF